MQESLTWAQRAASSPQGNRRDVHELLARIYQRLGDPDAAAVEIEQTEMLPPGVAVWDDPEMGFGAMYLRDASMLNTLAETLAGPWRHGGLSAATASNRDVGTEQLHCQAETGRHAGRSQTVR